MSFPEKVYNAIRPSYENALDLFDDAQILEKSDRLPRAYSLYHFAFEESGKCFVLMKLFFDYALSKIEFHDMKPSLMREKGFQDHISKLKESTFEFFKFSTFNLVLNNKEDSIKKIESIYNDLDIQEMDKNKNRSIYMSFEDNQFKLPSQLLEEDKFHIIKGLSEINLRFLKEAILTLENDGSYKTSLKRIRDADNK